MKFPDCPPVLMSEQLPPPELELLLDEEELELLEDELELEDELLELELELLLEEEPLPARASISDVSSARLYIRKSSIRPSR